MERLTQLTARLAEATFRADLADLEALTQLHTRLKAVAAKADGAEQLLAGILAGSVDNAATALRQVDATIAELQQIVHRAVEDSVGVTLVDQDNDPDAGSPR